MFKKGKHLPLFIATHNIPIVRVQADFTHLKPPIKIISEKKCMRKLGHHQY